MRKQATITSFAVVLTAAANAAAVTSAEIYTDDAYQYGRYSARIQFAPGSGVVSSFFLWKDGSEQDGVYWNELDFEKLEAECRVETNTIYGDPEGIDPERHVLEGDLCGGFHVYTYEWTPNYIAWSVDGVEVRCETGAVAVGFAENTAEGMQLRFNVWPGDATFGGDFDPIVLPVYEYIDWVEYSSYVDGAFQVEWREDFTANTLPSGWSTASWDSPKGLSTHARSNVGFVDGYVVLALTSDEVTGVAGANPRATDQAPQPTPTTTPSVTPEPSPVAPTSPAPPATTTVTPTTSVPTPGVPAPTPSAPALGTEPAPAPGTTITPTDPATPATPVPSSNTATPQPTDPGQPTAAPVGSETPHASNASSGCSVVAGSGEQGWVCLMLMSYLALGLGKRRAAGTGSSPAKPDPAS